MRRAAFALLVAALALSAFGFSIFGASPGGPGERHWAAAPLLAFAIVFAMGCLVALATARRASLK